MPCYRKPKLNQRKIYYESGAQGLLLLLIISQFFFNNGIYLFIGALVFAFLIDQLQQPYKPSIFTIIFLFHFIQISAWVWMTNYLGVEVNYQSPHSGMAILMSYAGLIVLLLPVIYFHKKIPSISFGTLKKHADRLSINKTFIAYVVAFFSMNALGAAAFAYAGLAQLIISLVKVKWFFFLLFGFQVIVKRKMYKEFLIFVALEFALGFFSFFSDFKTVFFFLACLLLTFLIKVSLKHLVYALVSLTLLVYLGITWTSIKGEYRDFLNQGSSSQTVQVTQSQAIDKLLELAEKERNKDAAESFFERLQYTWHIAKAMDHVPENVDYQNGANWMESLSFALTPRYFNPNKARYDASSKATKYTGIAYLKEASGVSFSLGYFADGYVDFGYYGMFIPLAIIGLVYGIVYMYFLKNSSNNLIFNYAVVAAIFMEFNALELDSTYLSGRLFATLVVFMALRFFFFPWLIKYLETSDEIVSIKTKLQEGKTSLLSS